MTQGPADQGRAGRRAPGRRLLHGAEHQDQERRAPMLEALTRLLYPSMLVVAAYLLAAGLERSGGGFAAGLVVGLGLVLRRLAGGPVELGAAAPLPPGVVLGAGLALCAGYAAAGAVLTGRLLSGTEWHLPLPGMDLAVPSSVLLEGGIAAVVVGLVLDVLRTLGAEEEA